MHIVVPFPPGGGADTLARIMEPKLAGIWAQPIVVENRPGASGHIGADFVAKSVGLRAPAKAADSLLHVYVTSAGLPEMRATKEPARGRRYLGCVYTDRSST